MAARSSDHTEWLRTNWRWKRGVELSQIVGIKGEIASLRVLFCALGISGLGDRCNPAASHRPGRRDN